MNRFVFRILFFVLLLPVAGCGGSADTQDIPADEPAATEGAAMAEPVVATIHTGANAELLNELEATRVQTINAIQNLSLDQWLYRESEDRWNIAEVVEHLVNAERLLLMLVSNNVIRGSGDLEAAQTGNQTDEEVLAFIEDRANPLMAPSQLQPAGVYESVAQGLAAYERERGITMAFIQNSEEDFRAYAMAFPGSGMKPMDAHQWFLYTNGHNTRHLGQIAQVKAHVGYPDQP